LLFRSWNRAAATWNPVVKIDTGGASWTLRKTFHPDYSSGVSLALTGGIFHLAFNVSGEGLDYVTGKLSSDPSTWKTTIAPQPGDCLLFVATERQPPKYSLLLETRLSADPGSSAEGHRDRKPTMSAWYFVI
jgi:hypothetical protein